MYGMRKCRICHMYLQAVVLKLESYGGVWQAGYVEY